MEITLKRFGAGSFVRYDIKVIDRGQTFQQVDKPKSAFQAVKDLYHIANGILINPK